MSDLFAVLVNRPLITFVVSLVVLSASTWIGVSMLGWLKGRFAELHDDIRIVQGAVLTLLALIIGFSFSMAVSRYDQRKNLEAEEANAIGTEFVRAELLPEAEAVRVKALLARYVELRVRYYTIRDEDELAANAHETVRLQADLWSAVREPAKARTDAVMVLVLNGMNDVLNSQAYTEAAWLNRIPVAAWILMAAIAFGGTLMVGLGAANAKAFSRVLLLLPTMLSIAFFLIADIDSPRHGAIRVSPKNLQLLSESLRTPSPAPAASQPAKRGP